MQKTSLYFMCWILSFPLSSQNWEQVGDLNDTPRVMLNDTFSGKLLVSGNFRLNGMDTLDGFFAYDGANFTSFGRRYDCSSYNCNPAFMIARYNEQLYFSGPSVTIIDGVPVNGIGRWEGTTWSAAMTGLDVNGDDNPFLDSYCVHDGNFYGVGYFRTAEGDTCNSVARWDGEQWTGLDFPPYSDNSLPRVSSVIFYQDQLYVAGNFSWELGGGGDIATLTNSGWEMLGGGLKGGQALVSDMAVYKGELYICGYFRKIDGNVGNGVMRWDGEQWKEVGAGICAPNVMYDMEVIGDKLFVVGIFYCVENDLPANNIATWDGERWCSFGNSNFSNTILNIASYKGEIYIGGGFTEVDGQPCRFFAKYIGDHTTDTCSAPITTALEPATEGFSLSPNPATDLLQIQAPAPIESVWVFDALGREVYRESGSGERMSVPVGDFVPGLYFVVVRAGGESWGGKFVKG